jgi:Pvc16 N-terminal domain/Carboxypeptidase regulatory-like domain
MIDDLSQTLRTILTRSGQDPLKSAQIVFDRPADPFTPQQTTVDLFLYDIREDVELRSTERVFERVNGRVITHASPLRVACSYLVTAWPAGETGDAAALLEQRLLSQTLQVFAAQPTINPKFLEGSLKGQEPPLPLVTALVDPQKNLSEFWTALGNKLRPSLTVRATISITDLFPPKTEPMVIIERLRSGIRSAPDEERIIPATLEVQFRIGGRVSNASNEPIRAAIVTVEELGLVTRTDLDGRFVLGMMEPGDFTLQVKTATTSSNFPIKVPAPSGEDYNIQLT